MTKKCLPATGRARRGMRTLQIPTPNSSYALRPTPTSKTGKSARLTSYCSEPFLLSALHLKKSVWEQSGAWLVSGAQLCLCWLIVLLCLASKVCRSAANCWNHWRTALLLRLRWWEAAFTHYHIFWSWSSFYCCEFHTGQVEPSFVFVSWLSHSVWHQGSAGVQSIVGIACGQHCFCD
jgi:hypothetical protein